MKKLFVLLSLTLSFIACKKEAKNSNELIIRAEYIYISDAAVLKGENFIYGVVLDEKAQELADKVAPMKKTEFDMVPVVVKGAIKPNPAKEGWEQVVEIKKIIEVLPVTAENEISNEAIQVDSGE